MSEHGSELVALFAYCIVKKVFEDAWLMMSAIFMLCCVSDTGKLLNWKGTSPLILKLRLF